MPRDGETVGEIVARGNDVMLGYYRDHEATTAVDLGGWFRTGDLAVHHPDGYVEIKDRAKDIIITGGENVASLEVERVIDAHPDVVESAVVGCRTSAGARSRSPSSPCAAGAALSAEEVTAHVRQHLAGFKVPRAVHFGELPKTSTGKIQKQVLRDRVESTAAGRRMNARLTGVGGHELRAAAGTRLRRVAVRGGRPRADGRRSGSGAVDALITGYSTVASHLMPANVFAERFGIRPATAFGMSVGGATGLAMVAQAARLVESGAARHVLVVAGEDRASGQTREESTRCWLRSATPRYEVPLGGTIPAYYALLASRYLWTYGLARDALAALPVQMRTHAAKLGAHFQKPITVDDVLDSRPVAEPLRLLDCCPVSDGGAAFVVSAAPTSDRSLVVAGTGQAHRHQHLSALAPGRPVPHWRRNEPSPRRRSPGTRSTSTGSTTASPSRSLSCSRSWVSPRPAGRGRTPARRLRGRRPYPMNTHGGLLSYGHCGVGGGMAHSPRSPPSSARARRQPGRRVRRGYVHADGGVLSAHVGVVLREGCGR